MTSPRYTAALVLCAGLAVAGLLASDVEPLLAAAAVALTVLACVGLALGARRTETARGLLVTASAAMGVMALAYLGFHVQWMVTGGPSVPSVAEPLYLLAYLLLTAAWVRHAVVSSRGRRSATLDAALVVVGPAAVVASFLVEPLLAGQTPTRLLFISTYPVLDLVLLTAVVHAALLGCLRGRQAALWMAGAAFLLLGDSVFFILLEHSSELVMNVYQAPYALAFLAFAAAAPHGGPRPPTTRGPVTARRHLVLVSASSCLPAAVLVAQGATGRPVDWFFLGGGALLTAVLAAVRLHWALTTSQAQATALDRLARLDELTGLRNRRELTLALQAATEAPGTALAVGVLDLDHFKRVNDTGGHAAGDRLLQQTTSAWSAELPPGADLYRWGGEEFVVVLRGDLAAWDSAVTVLERLRAVVPGPHTVSVGVAVRRPGESASDLLLRADEQLYLAKATGRDRLYGEGAGRGRVDVADRPVLPAPRREGREPSPTVAGSA